MFDGFEQADGYIAQVTDEATELIDDVATIGNLLTIRGFGLKIEGDETHSPPNGGADDVGLFFEPAGGGTRIRTDIIAVNEPRTLKIIVPAGLAAGKNYSLVIITQSSARNGAIMLKTVREMRTDFFLTAQG